MPFFLFLFISSLLMACQEASLSPEQDASLLAIAQVTDSLATLAVEQETRATKLEQELQGLHTQLALFLNILPVTTRTLGEQDTLLTLHYDFSFAGFLGAKYTQLHRTTAGIQLTQVIYTNRGEKGDRSFALINPMTGQNIGRVYASYYKQVSLSSVTWQDLMARIQAVKFFDMEEEDCGRLVTDGTFLSLVFHTPTKSHEVDRHNCPDEAFYNLGRHIEYLSPDPIAF
ncbi:MAG: hypothetical protein ACRBFS_18290 [Aureispira sp.]